MRHDVRDSVAVRGDRGLRATSRARRAGLTGLLLAGLLALLVGAACEGQDDDAPAPASAPAAAAPAPAPAAAPAPAPAPPPAPAAEPAPAVAAGDVLLAISEGSEARYRIKEQLARRNLPNDAIGRTDEVQGTIVFDADGAVRSDVSRIVVDMSALRSDSDRRDNYVRRNTLETSRFKTAEFVIKDTPGLTWPLPGSGETAFQLVGDMTLHGVTAPLTWDVTAEFDGEGVTGLAKTSFKFDAFDMSKPRVALVLSVEDNIRLEVDFSASISREG